MIQTVTPDDDPIDVLWLARGDVDLDVDQAIVEVLAEAEWTDPVRSYEEIVEIWPECRDL